MIGCLGLSYKYIKYVIGVGTAEPIFNWGEGRPRKERGPLAPISPPALVVNPILIVLSDETEPPQH